MECAARALGTSAISIKNEATSPKKLDPVETTNHNETGATGLSQLAAPQSKPLTHCDIQQTTYDIYIYMYREKTPSKSETIDNRHDGMVHA
jgi:hypothetical protein